MNSVSLNVAIGLIFVFLLYSLLATILLEMLSSIFNLRGALLVRAISTMLDDRDKIIKSKKWVGKFFERLGLFIATKVRFIFCRLPDNSFAKVFFTHPSIKYLSKSSFRSKPAYIEPANFSGTLIKILRGKHYDGSLPQVNEINNTLYPIQASATAQSFTTQVEVGLKNTTTGTIYPETLDHLRQLFVDSQKDVDRLKVLLEGWYNETMDRTNGWYKRQTNYLLFFIGIGIAWAGNVDTIKIYSILAHDVTAREQMVSLAAKNVTLMKQEPTRKEDDEISTTAYNQVSDALDQSGQILAIGHLTKSDSNVLKKVDSNLRVVDQKIKALADTNKLNIEKLQKEITNTKVKKDLLSKQLRAKIMADSIQTLVLVAQKTVLTAALKQQRRNMQFKQVTMESALGWILTAIAISFGAPFWFDILNKIISLRAAGQKPAISDKNTTADVIKSNVSPGQRIG
jgi:hypothetical protein